MELMRPRPRFSACVKETAKMMGITWVSVKTGVPGLHPKPNE